MKKFILAGLLSLLLAGCGPKIYYGPIQNLPHVPQEGSANIVFITDQSHFLVSPVYIPIIDGIEAYSLSPHQYVSFTVTPDEHIIKCSGGEVFRLATHPDSIIRINPQVGETVYLYCSFEGKYRFSSGAPRFKVTQLPEEQAQAFMKDSTHVGAR